MHWNIKERTGPNSSLSKSMMTHERIHFHLFDCNHLHQGNTRTSTAHNTEPDQFKFWICQNVKKIIWWTYHTIEHLKALERSDGGVLWCPCFPAIIGLDSSVVKCDCRSRNTCGQLTPLWSTTWWRDADAVLPLLSSTPLPLPDWAFTTCLASNNKSWPHPFYFCHDYSLTKQAGPGLPSERLDLTNIPHWMRKETKVCSVGTSDFVFGRVMDRALKHAWRAWKRFKGQRLPPQAHVL